VIARIEGNALLLDPRTVPPNEDQAVVQALKNAIKTLRQ
jgi:hypothetical protein